MRVCQIIESAGGSIRVALDIAYQLAERGGEVYFVYSPYRVDKRVQKEIQSAKNIQFFPLSMNVELDWRYIFPIIKFIWFLWKNGPFDVLHAHSSKAGGVARISGFFFPRAAKIYSPHAFVTMSPHALPIFGFFERVLSRMTDQIIAVSAYEKEHATQFLGIDGERLTVIPNAVSPAASMDSGTIRQELGLNDRDVVVGFVGRLAMQKNIERLIRTFSTVGKDYPEMRLVVIGSGPLEMELQILIEKEEIRDKVKILKDHDARFYYCCFDVLLCSSDYEGFPLVFLESLAAGVPIVTTPVGGAIEAVIEKQTGFVSREFSDESLAAALRKFMQSSTEERSLLSQNAFEHSKKFSVDAMTSAVFDVYERAVQKRKG